MRFRGAGNSLMPAAILVIAVIVIAVIAIWLVFFA